MTQTVAQERMIGLAGEVLRYLQEVARGRDRAVQLAVIAARLNSTWRAVAGAIKVLRENGYPIGTPRAEPFGAFWPVTDEDYDLALRPYLNAAKHMWRTWSLLTKNVPGRVLERLKKEKQGTLGLRL